MRIGELARRSGLAATALRYYEKAGLLPASARMASGYRDYDGETLPRLAFIRAAQAIGLSVAEIREVIGIRDGGTHRAPTCWSSSSAIGTRSEHGLVSSSSSKATWLCSRSRVQRLIRPSATRQTFAK
jgi:DNA-binding transcriptional MerR regulator